MARKRVDREGFAAPGPPQPPAAGTIPTIAGVVPRGGFAWVTKKLRGTGSVLALLSPSE